MLDISCRKKAAPAARRGLNPAAAVTCSHFAPSADAQTSLLAECPGNRPLYQPPRSHIRSLKASVIGKSLCFHGAILSTSFQDLPSDELHTSRAGMPNESNHP